MLHIAPMYSCRVKWLPGAPYRLFADGNLHCAVNANFDALASGEAILYVPRHCTDLGEYAKLTKFRIKQIAYSYSGPTGTRYMWPGWEELEQELKQDADATLKLGVSGIPAEAAWLANCHTYYMNVSKQQGIQQPVDAFQLQEVATAMMFKHCYVHDEGQLAMLPKDFAEVSDKRCYFNPGYYKLFGEASFANKLPAPLGDCLLIVDRGSVDYSNGEAEAYAQEHGLYLVKTMHLDLTKAEYYSLLRQKPKVWYRPDPCVWHVTKGELEMFEVEVVS